METFSRPGIPSDCMDGRAWFPLSWAPLVPQQRPFPGDGMKTCSIFTLFQQEEKDLGWMRLLYDTSSVSHFTASPGTRRGRQNCSEQLYFYLAAFLAHNYRNLRTMSYQEDVCFPGHLIAYYLLCFLLSFLIPWCLSTSYRFNLDHKGSNNSELKYTDLGHLQSVTEADTETYNLIYCFLPSLLMPSSSKFLHASLCLSLLKVNNLQKNCHFSPAPSICSVTLPSKDSMHPFSSL